MVVATSNVGKRREIAAILRHLPVDLVSLDAYPGLPEPIEDADTFAGNALKKARHYAELVGHVTLADDSGLEVDCLNGQPGVWSARYAGPQCDDAANNAKLIQALAGVPIARRTARFRCAIAVVAPPSTELCLAAGVFEGRIIDEPRGTNGFGYDPYFLIPDLACTAAELAPDHKNRISHRAQALRHIAEHLVTPLEAWNRSRHRL